MSDLTSLSNDFQDTARPAAQNSCRRAAPFSLRLSAHERERLRREAGNKPLGRYIRSRLFDSDKPARSELAEALGLLGQSQITDHLAILADEARSGVLLLDKQTLEQITEACCHVEAMRSLLIKALGLLEK